jgi:hypothetical protein
MDMKNATKWVGRMVLGYCAIVILAITVVSTASAQKPKRKGRALPDQKSKIDVSPRISEEEKKQLAELASQSRANLIASSNNYRESLEKVLELQRQSEARAAELVEVRKNLLDQGVIARKDLEDSEQGLLSARGKIAETQKQIAEVDQLIAEVKASEELAKMPQTPQGSYRSLGVIIRYVGASRWALSDFGKIDAFFRLKFGRVLPVSALGQTETHNRLGLDHHEAIDVAIHPDSSEGQSLINYLHSQGISFIAIRSSIPGSATGAHIHIGQESKRIVGQ